MSSILRFPTRRTPAPGNAFGDGWRAGCDYGSRCADHRWFWCGVAAGVVLSTAIVIVVIYFAGAAR